MPVDRAKRDRLADAIESFLDCKIDSFDLSDVMDEMRLPGSDLACRQIALHMFFFYSDTKRHFNNNKYRMFEKYEHAIRRWIVFLRSNSEWVLKPRPEPVGFIARTRDFFAIKVKNHLYENLFWPFASEQDYKHWHESQRASS